MAHRSQIRQIFAGLALLGAFALPAAADVKTASTSLTEDEVAAASARLDLAVDRAGNAELGSAEARTERKDLLDRAGDVRLKLASAQGAGGVSPGILAQMDAISTGLLLLADAAVEDAAAAVGGSGAIPKDESGKQDDADLYPQTATVVIRFHDVAAYALSVFPSLTDGERAEVRQLTQAGEDVVALIKKVGRKDHVVRDEHLTNLSGITEQLQALYQKGLMDRRKGRDFIPAGRTPDGWLQVQQEHEGLAALRASFVKPGTAWLVLQNKTSDRRPFFVELEFYDAFGEVTGRASIESSALGELRAGEVRKVEVPITPGHPRFWDVTKGFLVYLE